MTQDAGAHSNSIRFGKRAVGELHSRRRPHGYDVTLRTGRVEGGAKLTDNFDTAMTDLIEVIDRSDYRGGARFGGEQRLATRTPSLASRRTALSASSMSGI